MTEKNFRHFTAVIQFEIEDFFCQYGEILARNKFARFIDLRFQFLVISLSCIERLKLAKKG